MNVPLNLCKSTLLATVIFWSVIFTKHFDIAMFSIVFISVIPIFLCCTITITLTICPFFWWFETQEFDKAAVAKTYFPFYGIILFGLCIFGIVISNFEIYLVAFFSASFLTTSQAWVWFVKNKSP